MSGEKLEENIKNQIVTPMLGNLIQIMHTFKTDSSNSITSPTIEQYKKLAEKNSDIFSDDKLEDQEDPEIKRSRTTKGITDEIIDQIRAHLVRLEGITREQAGRVSVDEKTLTECLAGELSEKYPTENIRQQIYYLYCDAANNNGTANSEFKAFLIRLGTAMAKQALSLPKTTDATPIRDISSRTVLVKVEPKADCCCIIM